jgi:ketoreductase
MSDNGNHRVAVVTGATSGIGLAVAKILAAEGMSVYICGRDQGRLDATVKELRDAGYDVDGSTCDVTQAEDIRKFVREAVDRYGRIDVLVNNAGRSGGGPVAQHSDELWFDIVNTNLNSVYLMTKEVLNLGGMLDRKQGHVINIASTSGKQGIALGAAYSASKHGVVGFSKSLGFELARSGITVNAVCPGFVETPLAEHVREFFAQQRGVTEQEVLDSFNARIPLGRYTTPEEVAGLVHYLTTPPAASITAQAINVCGGLGNY